MASSCSMAEKTKTISVMITGHKKVMCTALILKSDLNAWQIENTINIIIIGIDLRRRTLKQRNTAA